MYYRGIVHVCSTLHRCYYYYGHPHVNGRKHHSPSISASAPALSVYIHDCLCFARQNKIRILVNFYLILKPFNYNLCPGLLLLHCMMNCAEARETLTVTVRSGPPFHNANFVKLVLYRAAWCIMGMLL